MEMTDLVRSFNMQNSTMEIDIVKTKPLYAKKTFIWELESIDAVMSDGVQRAIVCELNIGQPTFSYTNGGSSNSAVPHSKWKLTLDLVDIEPAVTVEKVTPTDKTLYYRVSIKAMKSAKEETDVIGFPNAKMFYEAPSNVRKYLAGEPRKFTLHKQLDYGCSYTTWFKDVLVGDSLFLKVDFETCESCSVYPS